MLDALDNPGTVDPNRALKDFPGAPPPPLPPRRCPRACLSEQTIHGDQRQEEPDTLWGSGTIQRRSYAKSLRKTQAYRVLGSATSESRFLKESVLETSCWSASSNIALDRFSDLRA